VSGPYGRAQCDPCEQFVEKICAMTGSCTDCCTDCQKIGTEHE
jgi:hypothetical protein